MPVTASKKNAGQRKPRPAKSPRAAESPATTPIPPPFEPEPPSPPDPKDVRRNARVRLQDGREGKIVATGAHRVRLQPDAGTSFVVERSAVGAVVTPAPGPKRASKGGPKALRIAASAGVPEITAMLLGWGIPRERLEAALEATLERLAIQGE